MCRCAHKTHLWHAELSATAVGERLFNVEANTQLALSNFDIFHEAGPLLPLLISDLFIGWSCLRYMSAHLLRLHKCISGHCMRQSGLVSLTIKVPHDEDIGLGSGL